jgi:hypothetical protein
LQLEQLEDVQLLQPDEPTELMDLPLLEKPKRENCFLTFLLPHLSQLGKGEEELGNRASKA